MRILVLSAPVGAGHDVAAQRAAAALRAEGHDVDVADGLAMIGGALERAVVAVYRCQLRRAPWTWRAAYGISRHRRFIAQLGRLLVAVDRRLELELARRRPDLVVSAYPLVSAALAALRRAGRLPLPCVTLVTDFDAHPGWIHPDLDANLGVAPGVPGLLPVAPPLPAPAGDARGVRARLGLAAETRMLLIVGGAWGVGNLAGAARAAAGVDGVRAVVVTGRNAALRERLAADRSLGDAIVLGFRDDLLDLIAACDALVQHAGGMTCLEGFALGAPVVMFDPVAGHGVANARAMAAAGVAARAADEAALAALLADPSFWRLIAPALAHRGRAIYDEPALAVRLAAVETGRVPRRRRRAPRLRASVALSAATVLVLSDTVRDVVLHAAAALTP